MGALCVGVLVWGLSSGGTLEVGLVVLDGGVGCLVCGTLRLYEFAFL